jgi:asparagine synthetase B (glutamine-hydrolysing)
VRRLRFRGRFARISVGLAGHPRLERWEIPRWIAGQIAGGDETALREIVGSYVALIDDRRKGLVSVVTDVMGTRPFFAGVGRDAMVFGSDVWTIASLGWINPRLNYDAIAAWICAGYDFTDGSLFSELSLVEPGAVTIFGNDLAHVKSYVDFRGGCNRPKADEFLENVHAIMPCPAGLTADIWQLLPCLKGSICAPHA